MALAVFYLSSSTIFNISSSTLLYMWKIFSSEITNLSARLFLIDRWFNFCACCVAIAVVIIHQHPSVSCSRLLDIYLLLLDFYHHQQPVLKASRFFINGLLRNRVSVKDSTSEFQNVFVGFSIHITVSNCQNQSE